MRDRKRNLLNEYRQLAQNRNKDKSNVAWGGALHFKSEEYLGLMIKTRQKLLTRII